MGMHRAFHINKASNPFSTRGGSIWCLVNILPHVTPSLRVPVADTLPPARLTMSSSSSSAILSKGAGPKGTRDMFCLTSLLPQEYL